MEYSAEISAGLSRAKDSARNARQTECHNEHLILALLAIDGEFRKTLARTSIDMQLLQTRAGPLLIAIHETMRTAKQMLNLEKIW
jgi:ATP-dependent Clp protease ATP-binding subunit ClpA